MDNMQYWNQFASPPEKAMKKIEGGRLSGMTAINDQWRIEAMTQAFGPCGIGWKFTVDRKWTEPGPDGQVFAFVDLTLYIKVGANWSDGLPGSGGDFLVTKESKGLHCDADAFKKATTDALGNAMRRLGVGSSVYWNEWTGKYFREHDMEPAPTSGKAAFGGPLQPPPTATPPVTPSLSETPDTKPATPPQQKQFIWSKSTSTEKTEYTLKRIGLLASCKGPDDKAILPGEALSKLSTISHNISPKDFDAGDMEILKQRILAVEHDLRAEQAGSGQ